MRGLEVGFLGLGKTAAIDTVVYLGVNYGVVEVLELHPGLARGVEAEIRRGLCVQRGAPIRNI